MLFSIGAGASHARLLFCKSSFRRESYSFVYRTRLEGLSQQLQYHEKSHTQIFISYEKNMISPDIFNEYGILKYWRFKDDMLVLATSKPAVGIWFRRFRVQSDLFSTSCTACSRSIDYLDLRAKISLSGLISTIPRTKDSNLDVPVLQHTSCHNPSIHML